MPFLALDIGTGSGRAAIYDDRGWQLGYQSREWRHEVDPRYPGARNFNTEAGWRLLCDCVRGAMRSSGLAASQIEAVSAAGMRLGTVLHDKNGEVLFACTNTDTRADQQVAALVDRGLAPKIYGIDGEWPGLGGPAASLLWLRDNLPATYERVGNVSMLSDWAVFKLSGEFSADPSCAGTSGMFDGRLRTWSKDIAGWLGIPMEILPPVREAGTVVGRITPRAEEETGLMRGTPVVQAGSDAGCGLLGRGVVQPGQAAAGGGTFWNASLTVGDMVLDPGARAKVLPHPVPGLWQLEGVCFYVGHAVRWFRDAFCAEEMRLAQKLGISAYRILDEKAAEIAPGASGVHFSLGGVIDNKRWIVPPPTFIGWDIDSPSQSTKAVFYRALLENAAFQIRGTFELLSSLARQDVREFPVGGGAAKSHLWPQILADVTGMTVKVPTVKEGAALGAAMCAAVGVGTHRDLLEASHSMTSWEATYNPTTDAGTRVAYDEKYQEWCGLFSHMLEGVEEGILSPCWRAAGVPIRSPMAAEEDSIVPRVPGGHGGAATTDDVVQQVRDRN